MSLETRISKTVVGYIDTAITSPPLHQPFQDADKVYDSFVKAFARLSAGIDMKQVYHQKPGDRSYLSSDHFRTNLVRLFLAYRVREQVPLALRPQPEPPLSLASVDLAKVSERTFTRVLFLITNANERASCGKVHSWKFDRVYQEFKQVVPYLRALPPYVRRSDDPHWLQRYSLQAINTVRALLAIQARLGSAAAAAATTEPASQPVPIPSLDSVNLKDVTHSQFLDTLNAALQRAMFNRRRAPPASALAPARSAPPSTDRSTDLESGSDTCYESDSEDQIEWELDDSDYADDESDEDEDIGHHARALPRARARDDDNDNDNDSDISTDDEDLDQMSEEELLEQDDESIFASEEDYQREFALWNANEAEEPLPKDVIGPLLDSHDEDTRLFTIGLLQVVLGVAKAPIPEMKKNIEVVLRELRRLYRMAHTRPWRLSSEPEYERSVTPFLYGYSVLSDTAFLMRSVSLMFFKAPDGIVDEVTDSMEKALGSLRKDLRRIPTTLEGLPECQQIMAERTRIALIRLNAYFDAFRQITDIRIKYDKAFTITGPRDKLEINVKHQYALDLLTAVRNFYGFDNSRLGMEYFPEFPATLIKGCMILHSLNLVFGMKFIAEFRKNEDIKKAANIAGELLQKWNQEATSGEIRDTNYPPLVPPFAPGVLVRVFHIRKGTTQFGASSALTSTVNHVSVLQIFTEVPIKLPNIWLESNTLKLVKCSGA